MRCSQAVFPAVLTSYQPAFWKFMFTCLLLIVGWVEVAWSNGTSNSYRMGADGKFDLRVVDSSPSSEAAGEPSSSSPGEEPSEEGSSTEEPEVVSPEKPQQESSLTSQTVDESSEVLVEAVRVEEIPDEGIFTSDDIIDSSGNAVVVSETATDSTEVVPTADEAKETVGEIEEVTEDEGLPQARPPSLPPSRPNISSPNISVGETARR